MSQLLDDKAWKSGRVERGRAFRRALRRLLPALLAALVAVAVVDRPALGADPQTPEEMYKLGVKLLDRGYYQRAVELFERIKTRYPFSQYAVLSELRIGDAHFKKDEYPEAVDAYQGFIKLHPRHAELDYVIYMIAKSEFEQAPSIAQRDQAATKRMLSAIQTYEERFASSKYLKEVQEMRLDGRRRLAKGVFGIGKYYYSRGRFEVETRERITSLDAAIGRFEQTVDEYPDVRDVGAEALYYAGLCQVRLHRKEDAAKTLERLKSRFPEETRYARQLENKVSRVRGEPMLPPPRGQEDASDPGTAPLEPSGATEPEPSGATEPEPSASPETPPDAQEPAELPELQPEPGISDPRDGTGVPENPDPNAPR